MSGFLEVDANTAVCSKWWIHLCMYNLCEWCLACPMHGCMLDVNSLHHNHGHLFSLGKQPFLKKVVLPRTEEPRDSPRIGSGGVAPGLLETSMVSLSL